MTRIKVLVIDDSALIRKMLTEILSRDPEIEVVGAAADPFIAREKIRRINPDVLTLDVEMPRMDGLTFLRNLMRLRPMPVVMVSTLTDKGADVTFQALELGAVDFVAKPRLEVRTRLEDQAAEIVAKVKAASRARVHALVDRERFILPPAVVPKSSAAAQTVSPRLLAIGASTGGTEAIKEVLCPLDLDAPAVIVTQHIPRLFSRSFAQRLDSLCRIRVVEASDGEPLLAAHAYIAPGDSHLLVDRKGDGYVCRLSGAPPVNRHRPSVDVMFEAVARVVGQDAVGVLLTGMGDDGAKGLLALRSVGAPTIAQDEATSLVWGMPGEAVKLDAAAEVLPLEQISRAMVEMANGERKSGSSLKVAGR